jgi:hypothetical protein
MINGTCPMGSNPLMPMTLAVPIGPEPSFIVEQVSCVVFPIIAGVAAPYVYEGAARLPEVIRIGTGMMMNGIAIPVRGFTYLKDSWNQYRRGQQVIEAAKQGDLVQVERLLVSGQISAEDRGIATRQAAYSRNPGIVTLLLNSGRISDKDRGMATRQAAYSRDPGIVTLLLNSGEISDEDRGVATQYAATSGNVGIITSLVNSGQISNIHRGSAVVGAIKTLQIEHEATRGFHAEYAQVVTLLLASGQISNEDRGIATDWAANGGVGNLFEGYSGRVVHEGIVTSLLTSGEISEADRGKAVKALVRSNNMAMITLLLNGNLPGCGHIDQYHRGFAVIQAAMNQNIDLVTLLLDQRFPITDEARGQAAEALSYRRGDQRILSLLLASGEISFSSQEERGSAANHAAKNGDNEFLKLILASGPVYHKDLGYAVREAAYNHHEATVKLLLSYGLISEDDRGTAHYWAESPRIKALIATQQNCQRLFTEGQRLRNDRDLVLNDIEQNAQALRVAIPGFRTNPDFLLAAAARNGLVLRYIPEDQRTIELVGAAIGQNPAARQWVPEAFMARALAEIDTNPSLFPLLPQAEVTKERAERAIEVNPLLLRFVPANIQATLDEDVLTSALRKNPKVLELIDPVLLTENIVNTVIQMMIDPADAALLAAKQTALRKLADRVLDGTINQEIAQRWILGLITNYFTADRELVIFALAHHGIGLSDLSVAFKDDDEVVLAAVIRSPDDWSSASVRLKAAPSAALRDHKECMLYAITYDGLNLSMVSDRLKDDQDVVLAAVRQDIADWIHASARLRANPTPALREALGLALEG